MKLHKLLIVIGVPLWLASCSERHSEELGGEEMIDSLSMTKERETHSIYNYFTQDEADTLLLNIVTFIGKKDPNSDHVSRFFPIYRAHFRKQIPSYQFVYYHISPDSTHYYYLRRPARSIDGNMRGAGGKFRLSSDLQITSFSESFVTPIIDTPALFVSGYELFSALIKQGHVDEYIGNQEMMEWPDHRTHYDTITYEWRYHQDL
jgi:hypothetical protein